MNKTIMGTVYISLVLSLLGFIASLQTNIVADAIIRALVVFVLTFLILQASIRGVRAIAKTARSSVESDQHDGELEHNQPEQSGVKAKQDEESYKGGRINLQTPDDDHFQPLKPDELHKQVD